MLYVNVFETIRQLLFKTHRTSQATQTKQKVRFESNTAHVTIYNYTHKHFRVFVVCWRAYFVTASDNFGKLNAGE